MLKNNRLATLILVVLVIVLLVLVVLNIMKAMGQGEKTDVNAFDSVILAKTEDAGEDYVKDLYFIGDSTSYHFKKAGVKESHLLVPDSFTLMLDSSICDIIIASTGLPIPESVKEFNAKTVIITLGVNGADRFTEIKFKTYYKKLIDGIQQASPSTQIIIQSAFPVAKWFSDNDNGISNAGIDRLNGWAKEIAFELNLPYLDTQSILKDSNGSMINAYDEGDGVHMNKEAYKLILEYIRTHAYK